MQSSEFVSMFDGVCDQTKELQTLTASMSDNVKWIISSSGRYMFVRFGVGTWGSSTGFAAKIHYGKNQCFLKTLSNHIFHLYEMPT